MSVVTLNTIDQANLLLDKDIEFFDEDGSDVQENIYTTLHKADRLIKKFKEDLFEKTQSSKQTKEEIFDAEKKLFKISCLLNVAEATKRELNKKHSEISNDEFLISANPSPIMTKIDIPRVIKRINSLSEKIKSSYLYNVGGGINYLQSLINQLKSTS